MIRLCRIKTSFFVHTILYNTFQYSTISRFNSVSVLNSTFARYLCFTNLQRYSTATIPFYDGFKFNKALSMSMYSIWMRWHILILQNSCLTRVLSFAPMKIWIIMVVRSFWFLFSWLLLSNMKETLAQKWSRNISAALILHCMSLLKILHSSSNLFALYLNLRNTWSVIYEWFQPYLPHKRRFILSKL